jgi:hypothetical protein
MRRLVLTSILLAVGVIAPGASPAVAKSCSIGNGRGYGTTYVVRISVKHVSCARGKRVIRAFHACRPGKAGRCPRVAGYRCREERFNKSPLSYDSRVKCTRGVKRVNHTYTQFT